MSADELKTKYDHLNKQLILLESDLRVAYEKYKTKEDPDFMKKRDMSRIRNRINALRKNKETILKELRHLYDDKTELNKQTLRLFQTSNDFIDLQNDNIDENEDKIIDSSTEVQLKDRKAQMKKFDVDKTERRINITIITLIFIILSVIPIGLLKAEIINKKASVFTMLLLWGIFGGILAYILSKDSNRSKIVWDNRNFKVPEKPKTKDVVVVDAESEEEENNDNLSQLINDGKCN